MKDKKPLTHPSFDELLALTVDELGDQRAHEVREHLLDCPACLTQTRQLLQLPDEAPSPEMEISDAELAMDWQRLSTLAAEDASKATSTSKPQLRGLPGLGQDALVTPTAKPPNRRSTFLLIAALVSAAAIGLVLGWVSFGPQPAAAQASAAITHMISQEFYVRGEQEKAGPVNCPLPGGSFIWVLNFSRRPPTATLAKVLVRSSDGRTLGPFRLPINGEGQVELGLPWTSVPDGQYKIELGAEVDDQGPPEDFAVSVSCR